MAGQPSDASGMATREQAAGVSPVGPILDNLPGVQKGLQVFVRFSAFNYVLLRIIIILNNLSISE